MVFTKAQAKSLSILDVARSLGMEMKRNSHKEYYWVEHDSFKIDTNKNTWHWYSHSDKYGDTINLVQEMRGVSYKEAIHYLETGAFPKAQPMEEVRQSFKYTLAPYEQPFRGARTYLKETRGLSDETIDFFLEKGVLAQARRKDRDGFIEDVLVFKYLDKNQNIVGASLQGLTPYPDRHEGKGYLKQIMYQSEGIAGLNVSIGSPERLVVAEAPIDLMSYYELHKSELSNVRLVAMEGLKEGILSRYVMETLQERGILGEIHRDYTKASDLTKTSQFLANAAQTSTLFHDHKQDNLITLAVDNDKAGTDFLENLREKNIPIIDARPPKEENQDKMDWNEYLKEMRGINRGDMPLTVQAFQPEKTTIPLRVYALSKYEGHLVFLDDQNRVFLGKESNYVSDVYHNEDDTPLFISNKPEMTYAVEEPTFLIERDGEDVDMTIDDFIQEGTLTEDDKVFLEELEQTKLSHLVRKMDRQAPEPILEQEESIEDYQIKLQWSESSQFTIEDEEKIFPYKSFVSMLYRENELISRKRQQMVVDPITNEGYILYQKTKFDLLTKDGDMVESNLRYDIGDETEVISEHFKNSRYGADLAIIDNQVIEEIKKALDLSPVELIDTASLEVATSELEAVRLMDSDADGVADEEELQQGTNPHDFRSNPSSRLLKENNLKSEEVDMVSSSLTVADLIKNKDMAGLNRHLKEGVKEYLNSNKYKDYLTKMSQLNNYSCRNLRLILTQNPEATRVASFKQWKETFGRYVKKGEKSIRIFAPMTKIKKDEHNQPILDKNGKPETVTFFGLVPVFDVSQTEGKEMPKAVSEIKEQLTDLDYANLYRALMSLAKTNDVSVRFEELPGETKGYYSSKEHQIVLRSNDMNKSQLIKTFLHEIAHSELHHANNPQAEQLTRSTAELQAESVAYVVASYYGIDTSDYSFAYLAGWSDDKETLADLEAQLDIVQQEAKSLMVRMDQQLEQLRLSQEKQTKHQFEQKLQKFQNQAKQAIEEHKQEQKAEAHSKKEKGFSK